MSKYNRNIVLHKLVKKGVKLRPNPKKVAYLEIPTRVSLGLKSWSMIDFLGIDVRHQKPREKRQSFLTKTITKKREQKIEILGECKICKKDVTNKNGFLRFYNNSMYIKLHNSQCAEKHNLIIYMEINKRRKV